MGETSARSKSTGLQFIKGLLVGAAGMVTLFSQGEKAQQTAYADYDELLQAQFVRKSALPATSDWSAQYPPSADELAVFEKKAMTGENTRELAAYQTAYLARHWPELLSAAGPRYLVGVAQDPDHLTRTAGLVQDLDKYRAIKSDIQYIRDNHAAGIFSTGANVVTLNRLGCPHCRDQQATEPRCLPPEHPDQTRRDQLYRIMTSNHETGHLLGAITGAEAGYIRAGGATWTAHADETLADTYASLRLVRQLGLEGVAYLPVYREYKVVSASTDARHHSVRSIESVMRYMGYDGQTDLTDRTSAKTQAIEATISLLKKMDDRELFDLARQLNRPVSPHIYHAYLQPLAQIRSLPPEQQVDPQNRLVKQFWATEPDSREKFEELREAFTGPARNVLVGPAAELNTLGRLNPLRPPSLQGEFGQADYRDPQIRNAMIGYNLARTPASCATKTKRMVMNEIGPTADSPQDSVAAAQKPADSANPHKVSAKPVWPSPP